ncbi:hypothetical protein [Chitinophaga nivalis]|uniref:Thioester reductase (TE) domain-containing protein n=1 Tax=Chitinophaga nivalis TaxID=2991709 RepID=A0ABT3IIT4_9BACT|nr:hypothetical protein [Chitinophaga nivalis]MCW3466655.1 hypothetical protein [Chitinophaga nivalis]MCW3483654.1 hypothetical protein [Chitinophaga nivalis]
METTLLTGSTGIPGREIWYQLLKEKMNDKKDPNTLFSLNSMPGTSSLKKDHLYFDQHTLKTSYCLQTNRKKYV